MEVKKKKKKPKYWIFGSFLLTDVDSSVGAHNEPHWEHYNTLTVTVHNTCYHLTLSNGANWQRESVAKRKKTSIKPEILCDLSWINKRHFVQMLLLSESNCISSESSMFMQVRYRITAVPF